MKKFSLIFSARYKGDKQLEKYQFIDGMYLVLDGTQYFSSENMSCPSCLKKTKKDGRVIYYHQVLGSAITDK